MHVMTRADLLSLQILVVEREVCGFGALWATATVRPPAGWARIDQRTKFCIARIGRMDGQILQPLPDVLGRACVVGP